MLDWTGAGSWVSRKRGAALVMMQVRGRSIEVWIRIVSYLLVQDKY